MSSPSLVHDTSSILTYSTHLPDQHSNFTRSWIVVRHYIPLSLSGYTFIACMLTVTWSVGSLFNGLCLLVFIRNRRLRSPTNLFIMALNVCDFFMCFVGTPPAMLSAWSHRWLWGNAVCDLEAFTVYFLGMSSMYILMAIAFDRYIAISKPLLSLHISKTVAAISCGLCFFMGFLWAIFPAFGWNDFGLEGAGISCSVVWETDDPVFMSYICTIFFFCLVIPLVVIIYSYGGVMATLRGLNQNSVWDMNSRVAKKNLAIEKKMLRTAILIVLSFLGCWMPYTVVSFVSAFFGSHHIPPIAATIPPVLAKCQGLFDPIIYVATNKQMRTALFEMIPCDNLKRKLFEQEEEPVKEQESGESNVEKGTTKQKTKIPGRVQLKTKAVDNKNTPVGGKQNQVKPMKQSLKETHADQDETQVSAVSNIHIKQSGAEMEVWYKKEETD